MRFRVLAAMGSLMLLLCSCSPVLPGGMADLLRAPTLNKQQADVTEAMSATLNLADIVYRYPQQGENNTSFLFRDLDGDGVEEAMVFYSYTAQPTELRVKILREGADGKWYSFHDIAGKGDQIEFVSFANLISRAAPNMIIGWLDSTRQNRQMEVFSMTGDSFPREYQQSYTAYTIADFGDNQLSRILAVSRESRNSPYELSLLGSMGGGIHKLGFIWLYQEVESILRLQEGVLWDGSRAIFLDELWDNDTVATEIIRFTRDGLSLAAGGADGDESAPMQLYRETYRPDRMMSSDINGDGFIEIPKTVTLPGIEEGDEVAAIMRTIYWRPEASGLVEACSAVLNEDAGYMVFFPERWAETVTVVDSPEAGQRRFYAIDPKTRQPGAELLRVVVYSTRDYQGEYPGEYIQLNEKGAYRYFGYIPEEENELSITEEELREMFALL